MEQNDSTPNTVIDNLLKRWIEGNAFLPTVNADHNQEAR
jgi:hypothetical protein